MARTARSVNTATALALAGALLVTGCSSAESAADEPAATEQTATAASKAPRPTHIPTPTLTAKVQPSAGAAYHEVVLGSLEDQTGPGSFESMVSSTGRFQIVMSCQGSGKLQVDIPDAGVASTIPCDSDGSRVFANSFPSQLTEPFQVLVSGEEVDRWSAHVAQEPADVNTGP